MRGRASTYVAGFVAMSAALVPIAVPTAGVAATAPAPREPHVASTPASSNVRLVPLSSNYELPTRSVSRDIGVSVALPDGHDLWLFGDTDTFVHKGTRWTSVGFIDGSTALEAKYTRGRVPAGGEFPTGEPSRFLPVPTDVFLPDGSGRPCNNATAAFAARWPTGAVVLPGTPSDVLITYTEVCVTHTPGGRAPGVRPEGWGYMLYDWQHRHIARAPVDVFRPHSDGSALPDSLSFGSPLVDHGKLILFASHCGVFLGACTQSRVWFAAMPATIAAIDSTRSYALTQLAADTPWQPLSISVGRYQQGLRLVEMTTIGGTYKIFSAPTAGAKWHRLRSGTLPGCPSHLYFCAALQGHPELSTSTQIFVSYKDPDARPEGHVVVSAIPE